MMPQLNPYLAFPGNCAEALEFYKECLDGEIVAMRTFAESPIPMPEAMKKRVLHAEFKAGEMRFMASDGMPGMTVKSGNQVNMSIHTDDAQAGESFFSKLSVGGRVLLPFEDAFWGARFGMLCDKYGVMWIVNCQKN